MIVAVFVLVAVVAAAIAYQRYRARQERIRAVGALARRIGFTFSFADDDHVVDMPFTLFSKGDGRGVELVCSGEHGGAPLRLFDYWYYDENSDSRGNRSRTYHRFTCAIVTIAAACPRLTLGHEGLFSRFGSYLGLNDVELEYDDFNQRFRVKCADQKFAFSLLDGRMMQWLLGADDFAAVEVDGPWVLLARPQLEPAHWLDLATWLAAFVRHVPDVVYSTYPPT